MAREVVCLVIFRSDRQEEILSVERPEDDEAYPGEWSFPATELEEDEEWEDAVHRVAEKKLGVEVEIQELMSEGGQARDGYNIKVRNYHVEITDGEPEVDRGETDGTDYVDWTWRPPNAYRDAAESEEGLSKTLLLDYMDYMFDKPHNIYMMEHQD